MYWWAEVVLSLTYVWVDKLWTTFWPTPYRRIVIQSIKVDVKHVYAPLLICSFIKNDLLTIWGPLFVSTDNIGLVYSILEKNDFLVLLAEWEIFCNKIYLEIQCEQHIFSRFSLSSFHLLKTGEVIFLSTNMVFKNSLWAWMWVVKDHNMSWSFKRLTPALLFFSSCISNPCSLFIEI